MSYEQARAQANARAQARKTWFAFAAVRFAARALFLAREIFAVAATSIFLATQHQAHEVLIRVSKHHEICFNVSTRTAYLSLRC